MKKGFTLIELLIVMTILGFLITAGIASYRSVQTKSRDIKRKNDLRQIASALEAYFNDYNVYPADTNQKIYGCGTTGATVCEWGSPFQTLKADGTTVKTMYMPKLPSDPSSGRVYYYDRTGTTSYQLYARIENTEDSDVPHSGTTPLSYDITVCNTSGDPIQCNYGVASTNKKPEDNHALE